MSAKYQIKIDNNQKYINIPLNLNHAVLGQEDIIENEFVKKEIEKGINPIVDYEKLRLHPEHKGFVVGRVDYTINLLHNHNFPTSTTLKTVGFENNDIIYRRNNFKKSFLSLMFFDSDIPTKQNLLSVSTMFNRLSRFDMVGNISESSGVRGRGDTQGSGEVITDTGRTDSVSRPSRGRGTTTTTESTATVLSRPTSIRSNELTLTDSTRLEIVDIDNLGTFREPSGGTVRSNTDGKDSTSTAGDRFTPINSGLPKNVEDIPLKFIVEDPIKTPRGFGEGYYLYHQVMDLPTSIYMRANYNNAKTGLSTDLVTTNLPQTIENIISKLHTKYDLKVDGDTYYYELDTEYSNNISFSGGKIIVNLFEIQVL